MKVFFLSGEDAGQVVDKPAEIARRVITIGMARLPTTEELAAAEAAEKAVNKSAGKSKAKKK